MPGFEEVFSTRTCTVPSFDIVSRVDLQEIDNAVNNTRKQIAQRYDFRESKTEINFDRKEKKLQLQTEDKMKMEAVREMLMASAAKRKIDLKALHFADIQTAAGASVKREVKIVEGIEQDIARKIVKMIKDAKLKVQASIHGEEVRVSGKQIDDLQSVITMLRDADLGVPLQFVNMKS
jgi:cyclic-di-GMP-binding protein